jgi:hypothetical protein
VNTDKELDLEPIEQRLNEYIRNRFFAPGPINEDAAALVAEVKRLRVEKVDLEQALHVAPVKAQLAIANHIFMIDAGLCLEVIAPLAHTELMKIGQQILEGVGQYDIQSELEAEVKRLHYAVEKAKLSGARVMLDTLYGRLHIGPEDYSNMVNELEGKGSLYDDNILEFL